MKKKNIIIIILTIFVLSANSFEKYVDFDLIKSPGSPRLVRDGILFTMAGGENKNAFLRTDMDNWKKNYYFKNNLYNVLYVFIPYQSNIKSFKYRININGFWIADPNNSNMTEDDIGNELSVVSLTEENFYSESLPIIEKNKNNVKKVIFRYYNPNAKEVNFVASIDNWTEYSNQMTRKDSGYWEFTKYFTSGKYSYYFFVDGKKEIDLDNEKVEWNPSKGQVSYFVIQ